MHHVSMKKLNPYKFKDYRDFLLKLIKSNGLTNRSFSDKYEFISYGLLSNILAKDKSGYYRKRRELSLEAFALLLKKCGYSNFESLYLILLRIENNCEIINHRGGSALRSLMKDTLSKLSKQKLLAHSTTNDLYGNTGEIIKELPVRYQRRLFADLESYIEEANDKGLKINVDFRVDKWIKYIQSQL